MREPFRLACFTASEASASRYVTAKLQSAEGVVREYSRAQRLDHHDVLEVLVDALGVDAVASIGSACAGGSSIPACLGAGASVALPTE